jgi:hypothetical protein
MSTLRVLIILFIAVSFVVYGCQLFFSDKMQNEFKRFELEKFQKLTGILELFGGLGLLIGLRFNLILLISSGGLALLMMLGFGVRLKMKDSLWLSFPSMFFMSMNLYVFLSAI